MNREVHAPFCERPAGEIPSGLLTPRPTRLSKRSGWAPKSERYRTSHHSAAGRRRPSSPAALPWAHRPFRRRHANEPAHLRDLCRNAARSDAGKGRCRHLDNLAAHKSRAAEAAIRAKGAWLLFLPPYSPDLNPIEMAFSKLEALLRKKAARSFDAFISALMDACELFDPLQCRKYEAD